MSREDLFLLGSCRGLSCGRFQLLKLILALEQSYSSKNGLWACTELLFLFLLMFMASILLSLPPSYGYDVFFFLLMYGIRIYDYIYKSSSIFDSFLDMMLWCRAIMPATGIVYFLFIAFLIDYKWAITHQLVIKCDMILGILLLRNNKFNMSMNLQQLCQFWRYQNSECRVTEMLKDAIQGYDNNNPFSVNRAQKQREEWLNQTKYSRKKSVDPLDHIKEEYLSDLLHPQQIYLKPRKHDYEIVKEPYGKNNALLKTYEDAAKYGLQKNVVNFQMYSEEKTNKQKQVRKHIDYVKTFYQKFGEVLEKTSPQFWKLLLFDLLKKIVEHKDLSNEDLSHQLNTLIQNESAIKYLVTFRKQLYQFLTESKFLEGEVNIKFDQSGKKQKKRNEKQKTNKWFQAEEAVAESMDFLKLKDSELVQKVPNLKRFDHAEYIQFRMQPLPKVRHIEIQRIRVCDCFSPKYAKCFQSQFLNTAQSYVFDHAYNTSDNMLVCAPTGAGKTNIATLAMLQAIKSVKNEDDVKIVYISPMKALANELVQKFSVKLPHLKTRESTGDIQLSQRELAVTNILVTTPQKWDVTTRKSTGILQNVNLVILDQVHLLNDERGWVIESIVARMFRTIERTQKHIRLVALSATLPNYYDVADFLKVDREKGLFYFDNNYRPVPLTINFVGVKNPKDANNNISRKRKTTDIYNEKCYDIAMNHLKNDKQVLIFVHSRKQTVKYCEWIIERAKQLNDVYLLKTSSNILKNYPTIRDKNLRTVCQSSLGFHHAGMVRTDRNMVEKMFQKGQVRILLATATLAWGVNLPAYAVVIKGTDIYDPTQMESRDLSILDVQQMFGRAGRPQYDTMGQATLMSDHAKVNHYMGALTNSTAIQSRFLKCLKQSLNAEITSGTVTNEDEAFDWLKYTFLAVRLKKCPQVYGCQRGANEAQKQYNYDLFIRERVNQVLKQLDQMRLIRLDHKSMSLASTELGRITSHYYIKCETMAHFCNALHIYSADNPTMKRRFEYKTDLQILNILSECKEFESIKPRLEEMDQLKELMKYWFLDQEPDFILKRDRTSQNIQQGALIETPQKVILLLQGYLRDVTYENFSLINDTQYVVQNSIRLLRCMLDLCSKKNQSENVRIILEWCKYIENRIYKDDSPLKQFTRFSYTGYNAMRTKKQMDGFLSQTYYDDFARLDISVGRYLEARDDTDRMALLQCRKMQPKVSQLKRFCEYMPFLTVNYSIKPIAQTILKIDVMMTPSFTYNPKWHNKSQIFWILFDDQQELLHSQTISIEQEFIEKKREVKTSFYIRYKGPSERSYRLTVTSDRWLTDENEDIDINLQTLGIDLEATPFTQLLNLQPLPTAALKNPLFQTLYSRFKFFNPIQTQIFFSLYQDTRNILIGAPTGSGKTIMSQLAVLNLIKTSPEKKCVYVAPLKSLVKQRLKDWVPRFKAIKKSVVQLSGDFTPDIEALRKADIIVTTPEKWDGITRSKERQYTRQVGLVIFDEIHLLGQDRGAVIEVIVSRMNKENKVRMIGLSTAMANGTDVAEWFGADQFGFFNFRPTVRPVPIEIHFEGFSEKHYCPRMATMNKPAFNHIKKFSDGKPVIIFVSSRRQTRLTANDLISFSQMEHKETCPYIKCRPEIIQKAIQIIHDQYLKQTLSFGIVMHHAGLDPHDRQICEQLFVSNKVQIMIATSTLAWGVNFPARLVIIKGTEYFDPKSHKYVDFQATDLLQMIGRAGRPQFDDKGVSVVYVQNSKKNFYRKFLNDPFPIESSLLQQLEDHVNAEIARGEIKNEEQCIEWITWSFMFRRVLKNPNYYGIASNNVEDIKKFLRDLVTRVFKNLKDSKCIDVVDDDCKTVLPTEMGFIASNYYLKHQTISKFNKELQANLSFRDLLRILSDAEEFKQTPLRHNEDVHNKQLSDIAPFKAKNYSSPQDKTFLLLQMHMYNLPFPIRDYLNDCSLILDSSSRVVMGMIEMAKEKRLLNTTQTIIYIQQAIYQGLGCNLPFITFQLWKKMSDKFKGLAGVVQALGRGQGSREYNEIITFMEKNVIQYDRAKKEKILAALKSFPRMRMRINASNFDSESNSRTSKPIEQGGQALIDVQIIKQNSEVDNRTIVQKHKKIKDVCWWVIVGDTNNNLLGLKKVSIKKKVNVKMQVDVPQNLKRTKVYIYLMADSYIGLDQAVEIKMT